MCTSSLSHIRVQGEQMHRWCCCIGPAFCDAALGLSDTYARILFVDYSSAFNTVIPQQYDKLQLLSLDPSMCYWLLDFLLQRSQVVKMNSIISSTIIMNTGTPQGCVLSPLLYSLFTNDCVSLFCTIAKVCRWHYISRAGVGLRWVWIPPWS